MGTLLMVPMDAAGALIDAGIPALIQDAVSDTVSDVFLFSHNWWADADRLVIGYSQFLMGFNRALSTLGTKGSPSPLRARHPALSVAAV